MFGVLGEARLQRPHLRTEPARSLNMSRLGEALTDPALDPPVAALIVWNSNPAAIAPDQERVLAGLRRDDLFTIVCEQFMTDTAAHADVILPATTQLEHLDVVWSWGHHYLTLNEPAIAPLGEARPNSEIFRLLAHALGFTDPCFDESDEELLAKALEGDPAGISLDGLRARGYAKIDRGQGTSPHAEGGFATPSGKLELRCDRLAEAGLDPLPFYDPPCEIADEQLARRFPLALLTPKTHLFLNSTFANGRRQHAAQPEPYVVIHPADAARARHRRGRRGAGAQRPRQLPLPREGLRRRARGRAGRADGLVERRLRGRPQPAGDDAAAPDDAAGCAHVQRQPRRDRARPRPEAQYAGVSCPLASCQCGRERERHERHVDVGLLRPDHDRVELLGGRAAGADAGRILRERRLQLGDLALAGASRSPLRGRRRRAAARPARRRARRS